MFLVVSQVAFVDMQSKFTEKGITHLIMSCSETELKVEVSKKRLYCCMKMLTLQGLQGKPALTLCWPYLNHNAFLHVLKGISPQGLKSFHPTDKHEILQVE